MFGKSWDLKSLNTDYSHPQKDRKIIHRWWFEIWGSCFPIWGIAYWNLEKVTHFIRPSFPSPGSVGELEVSSPAVAMSAPVALPVRSVLMGRRRRGRNGPRTWDIWACPNNLDYRNTRNMIVSLPSSFFGFYQLFFGKPSTSLSTGILMMTHKQLFGVIPIFRQIQLPKQKFGRPVIYPRAPQDLAATSCLTRLSKDPMANNPWVGQFAEAFLLEKEDELFVLADSGCLVFLFSFLYNKSHAFHMCIIHFRWNEW